ncbi:MAG: Athe_2463 domain-containing protein, partial [Desulfotomaculales bacterium]
ERSLVQSASEYVRQKFGVPDYFTERNVAGRPLRVLELEHHRLAASWPMIVWGDPHGDFRENRYRYVGYSWKDESVTNPFFPPDQRGQGPLDQRNWIRRPWRDPAVWKAHSNKMKDSRFDDNPDLEIINRLRTGLIWAAWCNGYSPPSMASDLWKNPQEYVHIYLPPSPGVWGMGVMFHRKADGSIWYVSVPLGPPLPDFGVELTPAERTGKPGDPVTFDLRAYCRDNEQRGDMTAGMRVAVWHQVGSGTYPVPFTLNGVKSQVDESGKFNYVDIWPAPLEASYSTTVTVHVQDVESKVVAEIYPLEKWGNRFKPITPAQDSDVDGSNNRAEARVKPEEPCTDISVVSPYRKPSGDRYVGFNTEIGATVKRANDGPSGPVQVRVTVTGPGGFSKVKTFNLNRGESRKVSYVVQVNKPGTATFTFHAAPVGIEDCAPGNNRAAVSFAVKPDPSVPPPESKSWVELISSR